MSDDEITKKYPASTPEVAGMFNLLSSRGLLSSQDSAVSSTNKGPLPHNLPVAEDLRPADKKDPLLSETSGIHPGGKEGRILADVEAAKQPTFGKGGKIIKAVIPYLAVFTIGIFLYYFFFSKTDFSQVFKYSPKKVVTAKEGALSDLEKQSLASFQNWMQGFYFEVTDPKALDPDADNSGNGLSNFQKYLLKLNPKSYDSLGLGMADSEALAAGINPLTGNQLTEEQKGIISQYIDMEVVMNRLALADMQKPAQAQAYKSFGNLPGQVAGIGIRSGSNLSGYTTLGQANRMDGDQIDINTDVPGRLEISSLNINVPIIWSKDTSSIDKDLQSGVVHYPDTALPGEIGTVYISGHSSNYVWAKGDFKQIFAKLGDLADNTSIKITVVQKNGKDARFYYVVIGRQQYKASDQAQFNNTGKQTLALSTCWPVGSTAKRLVVFAQQTQVEKD